MATSVESAARSTGLHGTQAAKMMNEAGEI